MFFRKLSLISACLFSSLAVAQGPDLSEDRIETAGGAVLTGTITAVEGEIIRLSTSYAGDLEVDVLQVKRVVSMRDLAGQLPGSLLASSRPDSGETLPSSGVPEPAPKPASKAAPAKSPGDQKTGWVVEAGANLNGSSGNTQKLDLGLAVDARLKRKFDRIDLLGRYTYGTNRGRETSNELVLGARYTNFFHKRLGYFLREEVEHDGFEGVEFRSTTAAGLSNTFYERETLAMEARSGFSYRYEIYDKDGSNQFPGMDFGVDLQWKFAPWIHFKGSYEFVPSLEQADDFLVTQDSGINIPLSNERNWQVRLGIISKYNNQQDGNREPLDHRYYARLTATWKED